jgi:hypothetical protein
MPMAAAYARTLIRQGKAQLQSHPALPVLALSRVVEAPTLRPVLLGLSVYPSVATAYIFTEAYGMVPLLAVVIDLRDVTNDDRFTAIRTVLDRLRTALPISDIVITQPPETSDPTVHTLLNDLRVGLSTDIYRLSVLRDNNLDTLTVPLHLTEALLTSISEPQSMALQSFLVARYYPSPTAPPPSATTPPASIAPRMIVQIQQARHTIKGVVQQIVSDSELSIAVPLINRATDPVTIQWQQQTVPIGAIGECWPAEPVLLLPVTTKGNR